MRGPWCRPAVAVVAAVVAAWPASAADEPRTRVGLVLGGGGARGGADIGVLRVMEELRVPVDCVAGTSIGALVGALYSAGYSPDEIQEVVGRIPWEDAFRDAPDRRRQSFRQKQDDPFALFPYEFGVGRRGFSGRSGFITGTRIDFIFRSLTLEATGIRTFDDLRIPYRAVAADLRTGEMVVLDHGDLARAMRASMSVPGVFTPVEIEGRVLVDGGIARNIPVDVARTMGASRIIAVDVGTPARKDVRDLSPVAVLSQTLAALGSENRERSRAEIGPDDLLITPDLGDFSAGDFTHILDTVAAGEAAARAHEAELRRYSVSEAAYGEFLRRQRRESAGRPPTVRVDAIEIEGVRRVPVERVRQKIETRPGESLSLRTLHDDLDRIWQFGDFEGVGYRIDRDGEENRLVIEAREKPWGPAYLRFGFAVYSSLDGDYDVRLTSVLRHPNINRVGAEWKTVVALGNPLEASTEFYQPLRSGSRWFVAPHLNATRDKRETVLVNGDLENHKTRRTTGGVDLGIQLGSFGEIRLAVLRGTVRFGPTTTSSVGAVRRNLGGPRLNVAIDRWNDAYFPTRGNRTTLDVYLSRDRFGADDTYDRLDARSLGAVTLRRNTFLGGVEIGTGLGSELPFYDQHDLGGFLRLSGFERGELRGNVKALFTVSDYVRVRRLGAIGDLFVGAALQAGNCWASGGEASLGDLIYSGTLFMGVKTKFSPVFLGVGLAEGGSTAGYVFVGRAF